MTKLKTLVLDAIASQHGDYVSVVKDIIPFIRSRKWWWTYGGIYAALWKLENDGVIIAKWEKRESSEYRRRLYRVLAPHENSVGVSVKGDTWST